MGTGFARACVGVNSEIKHRNCINLLRYEGSSSRLTLFDIDKVPDHRDSRARRRSFCIARQGLRVVHIRGDGCPYSRARENGNVLAS